MRLRFLHVGSKNPQWLDAALSDYDKKISRFFVVERQMVKSPALARDEEATKKSAEEKLLLKAISEKETLVLLEESGKAFKSSIDISKEFQKVCGGGSSQVTFLIGGAYGVTDEIRGRAQHRWSLSPLTFNHHLAQLVLVEQIYRSIAIWKNLPYHND